MPTNCNLQSDPDRTFSYDRLGHQTTITDGTGSRTFTYNDALQLAAETNTHGVLQYAFDNLGRPSGFSLGRANPPGEPSYSVSYSYDQFGRFTSVTSSTANSTLPTAYSYSYLPGSDLISGYTTDSGFNAARSYEPNRNLITSITNSFGGVQLRRFDYVNDAVGRRVQRADYDLSTVISNLFAYNMRSELEDAVMGTNQYNYAYDPIGNRRMASNNAEALSYVANSLNQYSQISNQTSQIVPTYDLDGNMTSYKDWTFVWDAENRLALASNATTVVSNSYDYMSRRVTKTVNGQATAFAYQGWAMFEEATASSTNSYVYGLDLSGTSQGAGTIGGILAANFNGTTAFYAYDANGNVTDLVGTNGEFLAQYQFDPYGNTISKSGALADVNPFRFSTKYLDAETGLYYYGHRYYQPESGRWASRDPIGEDGGVNIYCFNGNNPIDRNDILGLACFRANDCVSGQTRTLNTNCKIKGIYTGTPHVQWGPDYGTIGNKLNQDAVCTCSVKGALYCDTETLPCIQWEYPCPGPCNSVILKQFYSWDTHGIKKMNQLIGNANPQDIVIGKPHIECQLTVFPSGPFQGQIDTSTCVNKMLVLKVVETQTCINKCQALTGKPVP